MGAAAAAAAATSLIFIMVYNFKYDRFCGEYVERMDGKNLPLKKSARRRWYPIYTMILVNNLKFNKNPSLGTYLHKSSKMHNKPVGFTSNNCKHPELSMKSISRHLMPSFLYSFCSYLKTCCRTKYGQMKIPTFIDEG